MASVQQFCYHNVRERRLVLLNTFFSFLLLGFIGADLVYTLKPLFFYEALLKYVFLAVFAAHLAGSLVGRFLFTQIKKSRVVYLVTELLFIVASAAYLAKYFVFPGGTISSAEMLFSRGFLFPALICIVPFTAGIKNNYFLKISCGDFIDEQKGISYFLIYIFLGLAAGFALLTGVPSDAIMKYVLPVLILPVIISAFLIKLDYDPVLGFACTVSGAAVEQKVTETEKRDDLFFIYFNFTYIVIYTYLAYQTIVRFYGSGLNVRVGFFIASLLFMAAGFAAAHFVKSAFWHVYAEMLYPFSFVLFFISLFILHARVPYFAAPLFFLPAGMLFGFALYHTEKRIISEYSQDESFKILNFSIFILPVPIVAALSFLTITNTWYFVFVYIMAAANIVFPGIHLMQRKVTDYKKIAYFIFSICAIPFFIVCHLYFAFPMGNNFFAEKISGFNSLGNINYNADYITHRADIYYNRILMFSANDAVIRNNKRALFSVLLFNHDENNSRVLVFDGNYKMFHNPITGTIPGARCIDYVPDNAMDYNRLPLSGRQTYAAEEQNRLLFLRAQKRPYTMIVDIPNLYDQKMNPFATSAEYYRFAQKHLSANGIFAQVIDIGECRAEFYNAALDNFKKTFTYNAAFLFSHTLVLYGSNDPRSLVILPQDVERIRTVFSRNESAQTLFLDPVQCLAYCVGTDILQLKTVGSSIGGKYFYLRKFHRIHPSADFFNRYADSHQEAIKLFDAQYTSAAAKAQAASILGANAKVYSLFKQAEIAEMNRRYEAETKCLFELRRMSDYMPDLRTYLLKIFAYKEVYYYNAAVLFESEKKWEDAKNLFKAILALNPDNFEANYHLGMLSITIQNFDDAFLYLQRAMQLKKDNPRVLYQMGVLFFSTGKYRESLEYLNKVHELNEYTASTYYYIALCNEELGNYQEALNNYQLAHLKDANNPDIKSGIERMNLKLGLQQKKWEQPERINQTETERGETMPLPINKEAVQVRLKDPAPGEHIDEADVQNPAAPAQ